MDPQEQNDPIWKLLSHAQKTEPTALFARNVIREVRLLESNQHGLWDRLSRWLSSRELVWGTAVCAALAVSLIVLAKNPNTVGIDSDITQASGLEGASETFDPASEMASIEYLGQLMAVADPGQLDDAALADLFY